MEDSQIELLEQKLDQIAKAALLFQCLALAIAVLILYFQPDGFRDIGQKFSIAALIASFIISRAYIYTGKKLETFKTFSSEEATARKQEYFRRFFYAYGLWLLFYGIFSKV